MAKVTLVLAVLVVVVVLVDAQYYPHNPYSAHGYQDSAVPGIYYNSRGPNSGVCHVRSRPACANYQNWCNNCVDECNTNYECPLGHICCANPSCGNICEPAQFW